MVMSRKVETCLAIAVASNKVGYAYFSEDNLLSWGVTTRANKSIDAMFAQTSKWLDYYNPAIVITEEASGATRKKKHARALLETTTAAIRDCGVDHLPVERVQRFKNKYVEAAAIAREYPELKDRVPRPRRLWEDEHTNTILFEAMALWLEYTGVRLPSDDGDTDKRQMRFKF